MKKNYPPIILASGSPRRSELLTKMDIDFTVRVPVVDEIIPENHPIEQAAEYLARLKSKAAQEQFGTSSIILTADTIVIHNDVILGKPASLEEAILTLHALSDQEHQVITGVCLAQGPVMSSFSVVTAVRFKAMTPADIEFYVYNYEVKDKAGSYGIQDWIGATQIAHINGSYTNIMGLPTTDLYQALNVFIGDES